MAAPSRMRKEAAACAARAPKNPPVRPAGARFVRLGLHLIALWLSCSTACELWTALRSHHNAGAGRSWQAVEQLSRSTIRCSPSLTKRAPAGRTGGFWVLEQHVPRPLCACAKVLPHVAAFSVIMSRAPPVFVLRCTPGASQATVQPEARARIIAWISWLTGRGQQSDSYTYLSSVTRYLPELASLSSFARISKACHLLRLETYPPM